MSDFWQGLWLLQSLCFSTSRWSSINEISSLCSKNSCHATGWPILVYMAGCLQMELAVQNVWSLGWRLVHDHFCNTVLFTNVQSLALVQVKSKLNTNCKECHAVSMPILIWVGSTGPTWWKWRIKFLRLSSDLHTHPFTQNKEIGNV